VPRTGRPRVALHQPYWDFWEASVPFDLRADRDRLAAEVRAELDVEWVESQLAECVLVLETMASPPAWTLAELPDLPLVVWAAHRRVPVPQSFDHAAITTQGATVGTPMLTSVLVREQRPFELAVGRIDDPETLAEVLGALRGAAAATRLRGARIARIGLPQPGYACVDTPSELLAAKLCVEVVELAAAEVKAAFDRVTDARTRELLDETRQLYSFDFEDEGLTRSLRAAAAIEDLVATHELDAGAINCHVPEIRFGGVGVTPCFGLGRSASAGVPWSCTGDVLTAVALFLSKGLGGAAQYHELETYDYDTGEFVVASSGEHDLDLAPGVRPALVKNAWFAQDDCTGVCACFSAPAGPATLLSLADIGGDYRLIAAEGAFSGRTFPSTGTANAGFRFDRGLEGWKTWCRLGANHHSSASPGALAGAAAACARYAGMRYGVA
jgi:L-arabinose isomerase